MCDMVMFVVGSIAFIAGHIGRGHGVEDGGDEGEMRTGGVNV